MPSRMAPETPTAKPTPAEPPTTKSIASRAEAKQLVAPPQLRPGSEGQPQGQLPGQLPGKVQGGLQPLDRKVAGATGASFGATSGGPPALGPLPPLQTRGRPQGATLPMPPLQGAQ